MNTLSRFLPVCALLASIAVVAVTPAYAQLQCTSSSSSVDCTNSGSLGNGGVNQAFLGGPGSASFTNSGTIGASSINEARTNGSGTTTFTNSGTIGNSSINEAFTGGAGTSTFTNSGTIGASSINEAFTNGSGTSTFTNSGTLGDSSINEAFTAGAGTSTFTNSGTSGANSINQAFTNGAGSATFTNSGTIGNGSDNQASVAGNGTTTFTNNGTIGTGSLNQAFTNGDGSAAFTNSGTIGGPSTSQAIVTGNGSAAFTNSGTIGGNSFSQAIVTGNGSATFTNSGTIGAGSNNRAQVNGTGTATFINAGTIIGSVTALAPSGTADLTNQAGSLIVGTISLVGQTKILEFVGGNYIYTLQSMAGVQVNAHGAPFVVSGNTVAVLDPTGFALADRSVMNFTGGISSVLQDRFEGMGIAGAGAHAMMPLGFAPQTAGLDRVSAAHEAFVGLPSVSASYASDDSKARNALAMYTKAPAAAVPVNDITVWTAGFGGERRQGALDNVQRAHDEAFGGVIGIDRQFTPDLRLGVFAGGGSSRLRTDFNVQNVDSNYGFGGGYGRYDRHDYYLDFALFGGGISSKETRQVANNLVGFETALASYNGWFISPDVTAGYRVFAPDGGIITAKARVRYVGGTLDGYTETGSAQGLSVGARNLSDIEERLGIEFSAIKPAIFLPGSVKLTGEVDAVGLQRLGDDNINAVLLAQNIAFTTPGRAQAYGAAASGMVEWRPTRNVSLYLSGEGMVMDDHSVSAVGKGGVRVRF